jgi:hypothetical protein
MNIPPPGFHPLAPTQSVPVPNPTHAVGKAIGNENTVLVSPAIDEFPYCIIKPLDNVTYPLFAINLATSTKALPVDVGIVIVVDPATAGADSVTEPLVLPEITIEAMIYPYLKIATFNHGSSIPTAVLFHATISKIKLLTNGARVCKLGKALTPGVPGNCPAVPPLVDISTT